MADEKKIDGVGDLDADSPIPVLASASENGHVVLNRTVIVNEDGVVEISLKGIGKTGTLNKLGGLGLEMKPLLDILEVPTEVFEKMKTASSKTDAEDMEKAGMLRRSEDRALLFQDITPEAGYVVATMASKCVAAGLRKIWRGDIPTEPGELISRVFTWMRSDKVKVGDNKTRMTLRKLVNGEDPVKTDPIEELANQGVDF